MLLTSYFNNAVGQADGCQRPHRQLGRFYCRHRLPESETGDGIADVQFRGRDFTSKTPCAWRENESEGKILFSFGYGPGK